MRIEPPVSVPRAAKHRPAATAAAEPPLEPPEVRSRFQGLLVWPTLGLTGAIGELEQIRLADDHRAGRAQMGHQRAIGIRDAP